MQKDKPWNEGFLSGMRVLDLTTETGYLCGRLLADLGADVIKVEPPSGDPGRRLGPFYRDMPVPEKSLYWFAYNASKRGITLNIEAVEGKKLLRKMIRTSDVLVESFGLGYLDGLGLGYESLRKIKPDIIVTSISPFGQKGPYSHFTGSDIVLMAMGGYMYTCGDPDRPPLRISFPQACLFAGAEAAVGTLMAYYCRETTGKGQHVDVSAQHSITWTTGGYAWPFLAGISLSRVGQFRSGLSSEAKQRQLWQCRDGFVSFQVYGGKFGAKSNRALTQWLNEEGMATDFLKAFDWDNFDIAQARQEMMTKIEEPIGRFFLTQTKARLEEEAIKRDIVLFPVCNIGDILTNSQLKARGFWVDVEHDELGTSITYPGAWVQTSERSSWKKRRAPLVGEHNEEIYREEMGFSNEELVVLKEAGVI